MVGLVVISVVVLPILPIGGSVVSIIWLHTGLLIGVVVVALGSGLVGIDGRRTITCIIVIVGVSTVILNGFR